jgi:hypothetical protein
MDRFRLWGICLIGVCVFKLAMTPLVGVRPDPNNLTITLIALVVGGLLMVWSRAKRHERGSSAVGSRHPGRGSIQPEFERSSKTAVNGADCDNE